MAQTRILALCCLAQFLCLLDVSIVNVALPSIGADLAFAPGSLQWIVTAYTLALACFLLLGGRAADLLGRRETFAVGLALFGLASLAGGLAPTEATMLAARAGQGLGAAIVSPAGLSILATSFPAGPERNRALAWWGTLGGLGGATGAAAGGLLCELLSWRWLLLANAPLCAGAALAALHVVPGSRVRRPALPALDLRGALSVSTGLVLLTLGIVNTERAGIAAGAALGPLGAGLALLGGFVAIEGHLASAPLLPLRMLRSRALSSALGVVLCLGAVTFSMWFLVTVYLQRVLGVAPAMAGAAFAPISLTIVVSTRLGGRLATRAGPGRVAAAGMAVLGTGMLLLGRVDAGGSWAGDLLVPTLLCAAGIGCSFVPATIVATSAVAGEHAGLVSGVLNTAYQVGSSLGLAALAAVAGGRAGTMEPGGAALVEGLRHAFDAGAAVAMAGAAVAIMLMAPCVDSTRAASPRSLCRS